MHLLEKHTVPEGVHQQRLSDYLIGIFTQLPSRKSIKKALLKGAVHLNGTRGHTGDWINGGEELRLYEFDTALSKIYRLDLEVVYEDDFIAVVVKPAGIPVSGNQFRTVENGLLHSISLSKAADKLLRPRAVHRLDAPTSGLLLIAKTKRARINLGHQFEQKQIQKTYLAIAVGKLDGTGVWSSPIEGKKSESGYKVLQQSRSLQNDYLSLVELSPKTGRTHQLRIHLASAGHPILGDTTYGTPGNILKNKGLFLFAQKLNFKHPLDERVLSLELPIPYKYLRRLKREHERWEQNNLEN